MDAKYREIIGYSTIVIDGEEFPDVVGYYCEAGYIGSLQWSFDILRKRFEILSLEIEKELPLPVIILFKKIGILK